MKEAVIGDAHGVKLILNVPLKTASRYFILHKIIALPTRISDDINVQYLLDFTYFGIDNVQRNYILFTEPDLSHCSKGSITGCSVDKAIYCTQISNVRIEPVFFRRQTTKIRVRENYSYTTNLRPYSHTVRVGVSLSGTAARHSPMLEEWHLDI